MVRRGRPTVEIKLSGDERNTLTRWAQRHTSAQALALRTDIEKWVAAWNENPTPFVWHKTADQILERLAGYCTTVNKNLSGST